MTSSPVSKSQISTPLSLEEKRAKAEKFRANGLASLANEIAPAHLGVDRLIPIHQALSPLFPGGGLRRGSVVSVVGDRGATSLVLSLLQVPATHGSWTALVDTPDIGMLAASELGFPLARCVSITVDEDAHWMKTLGVAVGAFELVVMRPSRQLTAAEMRPLLARMREEGSVLIQFCGERCEAIPADVRLEVQRSAWRGLEYGTGRLLSRKIEVQATGKGTTGAGRHVRFWMPGIQGDLEVVPEAGEGLSAQVSSFRAVS